jgi:endonuclease/exonuclease/phosphatase (EEP) superfamily protein YafD
MKRTLPWMACLGLALVVGLAKLGDHHWGLELLSHFQAHALGAALVVTGGSMAAGARGAALLAALLGLAHGGSLWEAPAPGAPRAGPSLRVVVSNVSIDNHDRSLPRRLVDRYDPDVLGFLEVNDRWARVLDEALVGHPHRLVETRPHHFGLALYSRLPLERAQVRWVNEEHHPALLARVRVGGTESWLLLAHPHPPLSARTSALRDRQLASLARIRQRHPGPFVLLGDLNATPWSPAFRRLRRAAGLADSRNGHGWQPTWPVPLAFAGLPLDHVLVSPEWRTRERRTGPAVGSDHLPVFAELVLGH